MSQCACRVYGAATAALGAVVALAMALVLAETLAQRDLARRRAAWRPSRPTPPFFSVTRNPAGRGPGCKLKS
jgi:hypothetical protein